ncbi:MAG: chemotaxis protein CheW [Lachnospiraceae bacterium]|nr:chemotaxis protein CheW [Lachnospiraceae bacterium]
MAEAQYVIFSLGTQKYCMQLSKIYGIEQSYVLVPVPAAAEHIKGLIHMRGYLAPVYNLREKLQIDEPSLTEEKQLLISETHDIFFGFEVDDVLGIQTVSETDVMEIPIVVKSDETDYLESVIRVPSADGTASEIILCISVDHIMSEVDFENIKRSLEESGNEEEEMIR